MQVGSGGSSHLADTLPSRWCLRLEQGPARHHEGSGAIGRDAQRTAVVPSDDPHVNGLARASLHLSLKHLGGVALTGACLAVQPLGVLHSCGFQLLRAGHQATHPLGERVPQCSPRSRSRALAARAVVPHSAPQSWSRHALGRRTSGRERERERHVDHKAEGASSDVNHTAEGEHQRPADDLAPPEVQRPTARRQCQQHQRVEDPRRS